MIMILNFNGLFCKIPIASLFWCHYSALGVSFHAYYMIIYSVPVQDIAKPSFFGTLIFLIFQCLDKNISKLHPSVIIVM